VKPETDRVKHLKDFKEIYGSKDLIVLTENQNNSENLTRMMRNFHVPVGLNSDEMERAKAFYSKK